MSFPLVSTKFNIPPTSLRSIERPRLSQLLDPCLQPESRLALISAPAGYGKTYAVSHWLQRLAEREAIPAAWLTLDPDDNDPPRFLSYFVAALQRVQPRLGQGVLRALQTHRPPPLRILATLLANELHESAQPLLLVLDDVHLLTAEPILGFLAELVEHMPASFKLAILSRADPALPLPRLRARGQLVELRQEDLQFTPHEAAEFLDGMMGTRLAPGQLAVLERRTEGWAAGLQLAALSLRGSNEPDAILRDFTGENQFVADFLTDEVLAQLPEALQSFLLQTSILHRLSASLCEAVTGRSDAAEVLHECVEANLFLVPLDDRLEWFRFHGLFADLLRKRLHEATGYDIRVLHTRAGRWYAESGLPDMAVQHLLDGHDFERAAELIAGMSERLLTRGEASSLLHWVEALPVEVRGKRPALNAAYGLALLLCGRTPQAVTAVVNELSDLEIRNRVQGERATLMALLAVVQGNAPEAIQLAKTALAHTGVDHPLFRSLAADALGMAYTLAGDTDSAAGAFEQVLAISLESDNVMMAVSALTNLAGLQYLQGHLTQAMGTCQQVLDLAHERLGRETPFVGKALLSLGEMVRERGDLAAALQHLSDAARLLEDFIQIGLPLAYVSIARVKASQTDWQGAQSAVDRARQLAIATHSTAMDDRIVDLMQARLWIAQGDLEQAKHWAQSSGHHDKAPADLFARAERDAAFNELFQGEYLTLIRLDLAERHPDLALEKIELLQSFNEKKGYRRRLIETLALKALAFQQSERPDQALKVIGEALTLAEPAGYVRTFLDEGRPMARLLYQAVARDIASSYAGRLLASFPAEDHRLPARDGPDSAEAIEALSEREIEVLSLVAQGLTNAEIASRLFITLSTVKGHLANVFTKLNVKNRTRAVARARGLGLLPYDEAH